MILYFSLFLPCLSIKNVYLHPSNILFIERHVLKMHGLIKLKTAMIMYKANTGCLPVNLQRTFDMSLKRIHCRGRVATRNSRTVRQATKEANFISPLECCRRVGYVMCRSCVVYSRPRFRGMPLPFSNNL